MTARLGVAAVVAVLAAFPQASGAGDVDRSLERAFSRVSPEIRSGTLADAKRNALAAGLLSMDRHAGLIFGPGIEEPGPSVKTKGRGKSRADAKTPRPPGDEAIVPWLPLVRDHATGRFYADLPPSSPWRDYGVSRGDEILKAAGFDVPGLADVGQVFLAEQIGCSAPNNGEAARAPAAAQPRSFELVHARADGSVQSSAIPCGTFGGGPGGIEPEVSHRTLPDGTPLVRVSQVGAKAADAFGEALGALAAKTRPQRLIVDLRGNPGGSVGEVIEVLGMLLPQGTVAFIRTRASGPADTLTAWPLRDTDKAWTRVPIAVLVDGGSASAAELIAASLKSSGARIFGSATHGKAVGQGMVSLPSGKASVTLFKVSVPGVPSWQDTGLSPDVETPTPTGRSVRVRSGLPRMAEPFKRPAEAEIDDAQTKAAEWLRTAPPRFPATAQRSNPFFEREFPRF
jgi:hypothetical protein